MNDTYFRQGSNNKYSKEMEAIMYALEDWREAIVHLDGALNWENPEMLLYIFAIISFLFGLYWLIQPSFLMTLGLLGIILSSIDYFGPKILKRYISSSWNRKKEVKFEDFCTRLLHAKNHIYRGFNFLMELRVLRPYTYFMLVTPLLIIFTVLGWRINNLLIAYLTTVFFVFVPGLRSKGIIQVFSSRFVPFLRRRILGDPNAQENQYHRPGTLHPRFSGKNNGLSSHNSSSSLHQYTSNIFTKKE